MQYCYECDACGAQAVRVRKVADRNRSFDCPECEGRMRRDRKTELRSKRTPPPGNWPQTSAAAGIGRKQIDPEARSYNDRNMQRRFPHHEFDPKTGDMVFHSAAHRRRCLHDVGMRDLNSYYG
ncbi:MAG: hypothetical protein ACOC7S_00800 [Planctomycetota bacterium]